MARPRIFVSFDYDNDSDKKLLFIGQSKNEKTPFDFEDWSCKASLPQQEWEKRIKDKINTCNALLVLVSLHSVNALGVKKEIQMAIEQNVPVIGIYVDDSASKTTLPVGLSHSNCRSWKWASIEALLDNAMTKGKNNK